jgi:hypothetical protein
VVASEYHGSLVQIKPVKQRSHEARQLLQDDSSRSHVLGVANLIGDKVFIQSKAAFFNNIGKNGGRLSRRLPGYTLTAFDQDRVSKILIDCPACFQVVNGAKWQACCFNGSCSGGNPSGSLLKEAFTVGDCESNGRKSGTSKL